MNRTLIDKLNQYIINEIGSYLLPEKIKISECKNNSLYRLNNRTIYLWSKLNNYRNINNCEIFHDKQNGPYMICDIWDIRLKN